MLQTYRQTDRQTYRTSDEAGPGGAFAPKKSFKTWFLIPDPSTRRSTTFKIKVYLIKPLYIYK